MRQILHFLFILNWKDQGVSITAGVIILDVNYLAGKTHLSTGLIHQVVDDTVYIVFVPPPDQ